MRKTLSIFFIVTITIGSLYAQPSDSLIVTAENQEAQLAYNNGVKLFSAKNYAAAEKKFTESIRYDANFVSAYFSRANAKTQVGNKKGAIADFNKTISLAPQMGDAYFGRAYAHFLLGDYKAANKDLDKAEKNNYKKASLNYYRGVIFFQDSRYKKALKEFNKAISKDLKYAYAYNVTGAVQKED